MDDEDTIRELVERWRIAKNYENLNRKFLIETLRELLQTYELPELSEMSGIKRSTLYYMLWGRDGRRKGHAA